MVSLRPDQVILDPDDTLSIPGNDEATLAAQLGRNPFAGGHALGARLRRQAAAQRLAQAADLNNVLRQRLAKQILQQGGQEAVIGNLDKVRGVVGPDRAAEVAGFGSNTFSQALTPVDFFAQQAEAQKTASEAAKTGAEAGQLPLQSEEAQQVTGFNVREQTPLDVLKARESAQQPKAIFFDSNGIQYQVPIAYSQIPAAFQERLAQPSGQGTVDQAPQPTDAAQQQAVDKILRLISTKGDTLLAPPRVVQLEGGQKAIEYHVRKSDGTEFRYYAVEGNNNIVGTR